MIIQKEGGKGSNDVAQNRKEETRVIFACLSLAIKRLISNFLLLSLVIFCCIGQYINFQMSCIHMNIPLGIGINNIEVVDSFFLLGSMINNKQAVKKHTVD